VSGRTDNIDIVTTREEVQMDGMLETCEFKPEEIDDAIAGLDGLQNIIVPMLRNANYEGIAEQDILQFQRHIMLAKHALIMMGDALENEMRKEARKCLKIS
jgi:hypothetical protein